MAWPLNRPATDLEGSVTNLSPDSFWRFEDDLTDAAGSNDLVLTAGTETYATGVGAGTKGASFDGSTIFTATDYKGIVGQAAWSISAWINADASLAKHGVAALWGDTTGTKFGSFYRRINSTKLTWYGGTGNGGVQGQTLLTAGLWWHICVTKPLDGTLGDILLYVNGVDDSAALLVGSLSTVIDITSSDDFVVGLFPASQFFIGLFDEIAIFPDVLTPTEVLSVYNGGRTAEENEYLFKESTNAWVTADLPRGGSRYKQALVAVSDQGKVFFGSF